MYHYKNLSHGQRTKNHVSDGFLRDLVTHTHAIYGNALTFIISLSLFLFLAFSPSLSFSFSLSFFRSLSLSFSRFRVFCIWQC
jgi:hypothetical protein